MAPDGILALTTADRQALIPMSAGYLILMTALGFGLRRLYRPRGAPSGAEPSPGQGEQPEQAPPAPPGQGEQPEQAPPAPGGLAAGQGAGLAARQGPGLAAPPGPAHRPGRAGQADSQHRHRRVPAADGGHRRLLLRRRPGRPRFPGERAHRHGAPARARGPGIRRPVLAGRAPRAGADPRPVRSRMVRDVSAEALCENFTRRLRGNATAACAAHTGRIPATMRPFRLRTRILVPFPPFMPAVLAVIPGVAGRRRRLIRVPAHRLRLQPVTSNVFQETK